MDYVAIDQYALSAQVSIIRLLDEHGLLYGIVPTRSSVVVIYVEENLRVVSCPGRKLPLRRAWFNGRRGWELRSPTLTLRGVISEL